MATPVSTGSNSSGKSRHSRRSSSGNSNTGAFPAQVTPSGPVMSVQQMHGVSPYGMSPYGMAPAPSPRSSHSGAGTPVGGGTFFPPGFDAMAAQGMRPVEYPPGYHAGIYSPPQGNYLSRPSSMPTMLPSAQQPVPAPFPHSMSMFAVPPDAARSGSRSHDSVGSNPVPFDPALSLSGGGGPLPGTPGVFPDAYQIQQQILYLQQMQLALQAQQQQIVAAGLIPGAGMNTGVPGIPPLASPSDASLAMALRHSLVENKAPAHVHKDKDREKANDSALELAIQESLNASSTQPRRSEEERKRAMLVDQANEEALRKALELSKVETDASNTKVSLNTYTYTYIDRR